MKKQNPIDIKVAGNGKILPLTFHSFLGDGVMAKDNEVTLGFSTDSYGIDLTMTKAQAKAMSEKLKNIAK